MIEEHELAYITKNVENGLVNAIVANKIITSLRKQQREIMQLKQQLKNCQKECWNLKKQGYR